MSTKTARAFELTFAANGYVSFSDGDTVLVRFHPSSEWRWEYYRTLQRGPSRGLEMFQRYLTDAEGERLDRVVARQREICLLQINYARSLGQPFRVSNAA